MSSAGIILEDTTKIEEAKTEPEIIEVEDGDFRKKSTEELKEMLKTALEDESYEKASQIRDEINNRKKS